MKRILIFISLLLLGTAAQADNLKKGVYISSHIGGNEIHYKSDNLKESDTSFSWLIAVGVRSRVFRAEVEVADVLRTNIDDLKINQQRYMLQGYYDIPIPDPTVRPFLNLGAGATYTEVYNSLTRKNSDKTTFSWNAGAGIAINVSSVLSFDLGYRYIDAGKPRFAGESVQMSNHEVYAGVRYAF